LKKYAKRLQTMTKKIEVANHPQAKISEWVDVKAVL
jgi:hypothetical protein